MTLIELLQGISYTTPSDQALLEQLEITKITEDSRAVTVGTLFVALRGTQADGHRFIPSAIEAGSRAIVLETLPEELQEGVAYIVVPSSSEVLGLLSSALHGHPSRQLTVVGVTGTNGKTTIATLLFRLFRALGYRCGLLSTVCNYIEDEAISATHTTPSAPELQSLLGRMRDAGCLHGGQFARSGTAPGCWATLPWGDLH